MKYSFDFLNMKAMLDDPALFDCVAWRKRYAPALIARIQELEAELANAKALGAAEELERMADALRELTTEDCSPAIGEDDLRRKAAQLRKGLA